MGNNHNMNLQESIRRILRESLESEWNEGNYDYQHGFCHYFAYNIIDKIRERFPNKKVNYYLLLANEVNKDTDEVEQDYLLHAYIKIGDKLLDSNGFTTKNEVEQRVDDWYNRQLTMTPEEYDINVWEEESDEIPEMFFNNRFCNTKRVKEDMDKFLLHPSVKKLLKDTLNESVDENNIKKNLKVINIILDQISWNGLCKIWVVYNKTDREYEVRSISLKKDYDHDEILKELDYIDNTLRSMGLRTYIFTPWYVENCKDEVEFFNESIKKRLRESEDKKEKSLESLEKSVKKFINMHLEDYELPEEFFKVAVDVFDNEYDRKECIVTMLFEKPFKLHDSDRMHDIMNEIKKEIKEYFGNTFWYIKLGTSTADVYNSTKDWYTKRKKNITESENKKSGLLRAIEEDGLFQVIQDTGLSMEQIILKYDNLPREVFERYIKDFIRDDGYHMQGGDIQLRYSVELSRTKVAESFYLSGDKVTVELNEYDKYGMQTSGIFERLENLSDDEIFTIVDDMSQSGDNLYLNINESKDKEKTLLKNISNLGLYDFIKMTGISLMNIQTKVGQIPKQMLEQFIKDYVSNEGLQYSSAKPDEKIVSVDVRVGGNAIIDYIYYDGKNLLFEITEYAKGFSKEETDQYIESSKNYGYDPIFNIANKITRKLVN